MKFQRCVFIRQWIWLGAVTWNFAGTPSVFAGSFSSFFSHDVDIITVTDVTDAGKSYPTPTPAKPVYYMIMDVGLTNFGRSWAGERIPNRNKTLRTLMAAMAEQGYRLADSQHPPTQLFVFGWGMLKGGASRPALQFLGGDKVGLTREPSVGGFSGFFGSPISRAGFSFNGLAETVFEFSESDLFLCVVRSFTMDSLDGPKTTKLWETRFACPATGLALTDVMPLMIKAAARNLGRETIVPVNLNASEEFHGEVTMGPMRFLEDESPSPTPPESADQATPPKSK